MSGHEEGSYYLPEPSYWPIVGSIALFCIMFGAGNWIHGKIWGTFLFFTGIGIMIYMMFGWFGTVIAENQAGLFDNPAVDRSFRWGMIWFIFSEVMFFGVFFWHAVLYQSLCRAMVRWFGHRIHDTYDELARF